MVQYPHANKNDRPPDMVVPFRRRLRNERVDTNLFFVKKKI
jgi:hypothetical protein